MKNKYKLPKFIATYLFYCSGLSAGEFYFVCFFLFVIGLGIGGFTKQVLVPYQIVTWAVALSLFDKVYDDIRFFRKYRKSLGYICMNLLRDQRRRIRVYVLILMFVIGALISFSDYYIIIELYKQIKSLFIS